MLYLVLATDLHSVYLMNTHVTVDCGLWSCNAM
jgi:hypothetical protein